MSEKTRRKKRGRPNGIGIVSVLAMERLRCGLSQQEVAEATNFSQPYVSKAERDGVPDALYLYRVGKLFKVPSLGEFFEKYVKERFERFERIPTKFVSITPKEYQSVSTKEANTGQSESSPPPLAPTDSSVDQRDDVDSEASTT